MMSLLFAAMLIAAAVAGGWTLVAQVIGPAVADCADANCN
jgi:archaellum component FlaG (FlaF/FlaG flagellin family)